MLESIHLLRGPSINVWNKLSTDCVHASIAVLGIKGSEEQWRYCTSDVDSTLGFALGAMFVKETFHSNSKQKVHETL